MATINSWGATNPVNPNSGGTGDTSLTVDGVLIGNGTSAVQATAAGTNGQILVGDTGNPPGWVTPTATSGGNLAVTTNSSTLSYGINAPVTFANGGTGLTSAPTAYTVICGPTSGGTALQSVTSVGPSGSVLTSNGAGALPTFQGLSGSSISVTGDSGGTLTGVSNLGLTGGSTPFTFVGSGSTETLTWNTAVPVAHGGTGLTTTTAYELIASGTTSTGNFQQISNATSGYVLTSNGSGSLPTFQASGGNSITLDTDSGGPITGVTTLTLAGGSTPFTFVGSGSGTATLTWGSAVPVADGGTGKTSTTAYAVLCGGTTSTGALQSVASVGTSGQVLTSNGAGSLPTFQSLSGSSISVTGDTGGTLTGVSNLTLAGGTTGLSFGGSGSTETLTFAGITANGGTVNLGTDNMSNAINIGLGTTARAIHIGDSAAAHVITIGSETGACSITEHVGTGNYTLDGAATSTITEGASLTSGTITIGGTAMTGTLTVGSSSATNTQVIAGGSGATALQLANTQTGGSVVIGNSMTTGTISIGGTGAQTGTVTLSASTGAQTVNIANANGAKSINIGNGVSGNTIDIGNGVNTSSQTINIASGAAGANSTVNILAGVSTTGTQTVNIASGAAASTTNIGNSTGASAVNISSGSGGISLTGAVTSADAITITSGALTVTAGNIVLTEDNLELPQTVSSSTGVVTFGGTSFLHTYGALTDKNIFLGQGAGNFSLTSGTAIGSIGIGYEALSGLTTGPENNCIGNKAGNALTTGQKNTTIGHNSLVTATSGSYNCCIGYLAGSNYTGSESSNIQIGYEVDGTASESNVLRIGNGTGTSAGNINQAIICGIDGKTSSSGVETYTNSSNVLGTSTSTRESKENIQPIGDDSSIIYKMNPVSFTYKKEWTDGRETPENAQLKQYGLIAEEVAELDPGLVKYTLDGKPDTVRYHFIMRMMLNELQKLEKRVKELENR
jgi:hypothetical protein